MDLITFLQSLTAEDWAHAATVGVTVGALIFRLIEWLDTQLTIPPAVKRVGAIVLAAIVPPGAYFGLTALTHAALTANGWFLAACVVVAAVGYVTAHNLHATTERAQ